MIVAANEEATKHYSKGWFIHALPFGMNKYRD